MSRIAPIEPGSPEERCVGAILRSCASGGAPVLPDPVDRRRVVRFATVNGVEPLFHHALRAEPAWREEIAPFGALRQRTLLANLRSLRVGLKVCAALEGAGLRAVALRGLALAHLYYADPGLRPMKDLDILVETAAPEQVERAMRAAGFPPGERLRVQLAYTIDQVRVELHLALLTARRYQDRLDPDEFFARRVPAGGPCAGLHVAPGHLELFELVTHALVHHELTSLTSLVDVALVLRRPDLDWQALAATTRRAGLDAMFAFTLGLVDGLFDTGCAPRIAALGPAPALADPGRRRAWLARYFGGDGLGRFAERKRTMVALAPSRRTKLTQTLRFLSPRDLKELFQACRLSLQ